MSGGEAPGDRRGKGVSGGIIVAGVLVLLLVVGGVFLLIALTQGEVANPGGDPGEQGTSLPAPTLSSQEPLVS